MPPVSAFVIAEMLWNSEPVRASAGSASPYSVVLLWFDHTGGPAVRAVWTVEAEGDRITRLRNYFFAPEVIAEVCRELTVPFRINGYRYW